MKMIHCGDLHLDSKMESHLEPSKAKARRYEILGTFERMVEYAIANDIGVILIAGDMFDTAKNRHKPIKSRVLELVANNPGIDFLYLQGNHDNDDYFKSLPDQPANLKLFGSSWTKYRYENVVVAGVELESGQCGCLWKTCAK